MKKILLPIFLLVFLAVCSGGTKKTNLEKENLNGKIKILKETRYEAVEKDGKITKGEKIYDSVVTMYDETGNATERKEYAPDGGLVRADICKYDNNGNQIEESRYNADRCEWKGVYNYDEKGNLIEVSDYGVNSKRVYKYDKKGNRIEYRYYNSDGSLNNKLAFKYDERGNMIERNRYDSDGDLQGTITLKYEFDEKNNWTTKIEHSIGFYKTITVREIEYY